LRGRLNRALRAARRRARRHLLRAVGLPLALVLERAARSSNRGLGIGLVYHRVGEPAGDPRRELVPALATSLFEAQVRHLASRYRVVAASDLLNATRDRPRGGRFPVAITFDDDLPSHLEVVAPILTSAGATATFYVTGASLRGPHRFWWERLQAAVDRNLDLASLGLGPARGGTGIHEVGRRIQDLPPGARDELDAKLQQLVGPDPPEAGLRAEGLRRLAASGVEIGFHTRRHDLLPALGADELEHALRDGRGELEQVVGRPLTTISYPHGRANARVAAAARAAGFDAGLTGQPTVVTPASEALLLGRLSPSYTSLGELAFDVAWTLFRASTQR
jgi:peptidoglycan/xylan/chitin deacetylase (PgdA/CDA1 family)